MSLLQIKTCLNTLRWLYLAILVLVLNWVHNLIPFLIVNIILDIGLTVLYLKLKAEFKNPKVININNFKSPRLEPNLNKIRDFQGEIPCILGYDENYNPLILDLAVLGSTLIVGKTGRGKSNFIHVLLQAILKKYKGSALFLVDFKKIELADYKDFQQIHVINSETELLKVLKNLKKEMESRYQKFLKVPYGQKTFKSIKEYNRANPSQEMPYIMLIIDEFGDFGDDENEEIWNILKELARKIRAAGIVMILATHRATKENIQPGLKALISTTIGFGMSTEMESSYIGLQGCSKLQPGEFIISSPLHNNQQYKSYIVDEQDKTWANLLRRYGNDSSAVNEK